MTPAEMATECRRGAEVIIKREVGGQIRDRLASLGVVSELDDVLQSLAAQLAPSVENAMRAHLVTNKIATEQVTVIDWDKVHWPLSFDPAKVTVTKSEPEQSLAIRAAAEVARAVGEVFARPVAKAAPATVAAPKAPQIITVRLAPTDREALLTAITALKPASAGDISITHSDGRTTTLTRGPSLAATTDQAKPPPARPQLPPRPPANQSVDEAFWDEQETSASTARRLNPRGNV